MDEKTELLICLGAATAANCVRCFEYYFKKARDAELEAGQIMQAVELANKVKMGTSIFMSRSISDIMGGNGEPDGPIRTARSHSCCN